MMKPLLDSWWDPHGILRSYVKQREKKRKKGEEETDEKREKEKKMKRISLCQ